MGIHDEVQKLFQKAVTAYKSRQAPRYEAGYRVTFEETVISCCPGDMCCSGAGAHLTIEYELRDRRYLEAMKDVCGFQRTFRQFASRQGGTEAIEVIAINGAPKVDIYLQSSSFCEKCCAAIVMPVCLPIMLYQCCIAEDVREKAVESLFDLIANGEKWVSATLTQQPIARQPSLFIGGASLFGDGQSSRAASRGPVASVREAQSTYSGDPLRQPLLAAAVRGLSTEQQDVIIQQYFQNSGLDGSSGREHLRPVGQ